MSVRSVAIKLNVVKAPHKVSNQRIGILSGTFDPVHIGHVQFALDAAKAAHLDRVYFMVERNPRRKQGVRAFEHRQAMVQLAIEDSKDLGSIITEQDRFTPHDTLPLLKGRFGDVQLVLLIGDDMLSHMHEWPNVEELLGAVEFVIGVRDDENLAKEKIQLIEQTKSVKFKHTFIESRKQLVSSSKIRMQVKNRQQPSAIHSFVAQYIQEHGLYASRDEA